MRKISESMIVMLWSHFSHLKNLNTSVCGQIEENNFNIELQHSAFYKFKDSRDKSGHPEHLEIKVADNTHTRSVPPKISE